MKYRDLTRQYAALKSRIDEAMRATCEEASFIGGRRVVELEAELADYCGVKHCLTCANGTDALQLALMAWGVGPGDAVFVPDFTFFASGEVVSVVGAVPVFVDVNPLTFNLDASSLEGAVKHVLEETDLVPKACVAVDLYGLPADYQAIRQVCERYGLRLLEDGAQGFGGSIGGKRACSFGDISTTSFFPGKPLGCYGDGGAVFTDNDEWDTLMRSLAVHGKGATKYDNVRIGMNSRLDALQAAILEVKLDAFKSYELEAVDRAARRYSEVLCGIDCVLPQVPEGFSSSWGVYTVQLPVGVDRDRLQTHLKDAGVPTMVYYPKPMHEQKAFEDAHLCPNGCPETERLCGTVLSLPMGPYLHEEEIEVVATRLFDLLADAGASLD